MIAPTPPPAAPVDPTVPDSGDDQHAGALQGADFLLLLLLQAGQLAPGLTPAPEATTGPALSQSGLETTDAVTAASAAPTLPGTMALAPVPDPARPTTLVVPTPAAFAIAAPAAVAPLVSGSTKVAEAPLDVQSQVRAPERVPAAAPFVSAGPSAGVNEIVGQASASTPTAVPGDFQSTIASVVTPSPAPAPPQITGGTPAVATAAAGAATAVVAPVAVAAATADAPEATSTEPSGGDRELAKPARAPLADGRALASDPRGTGVTQAEVASGPAVTLARRGVSIAPVEDRGATGPRDDVHVDGTDRGPVDVQLDTPVPTATGVHARAASSADTESRTEAAPLRPVVEQVVARVATIHREGRQEMSFRLDPPELGRVSIEAVLEGRHLVLHIRTEDERARDVLQQDLPRLQESLAQHGFVADRVSIDLDVGAGGRQLANGGFAEFTRPERPDAPNGSARLTAVASLRPASVEGVDIWV